jgi:hypothetical protein
MTPPSRGPFLGFDESVEALTAAGAANGTATEEMEDEPVAAAAVREVEGVGIAVGAGLSVRKHGHLKNQLLSEPSLSSGWDFFRAIFQILCEVAQNGNELFVLGEQTSPCSEWNWTESQRVRISRRFVTAVSVA